MLQLDKGMLKDVLCAKQTVCACCLEGSLAYCLAVLLIETKIYIVWELQYFITFQNHVK